MNSELVKMWKEGLWHNFEACLMYLIASTEQAGTLVIHSLPDLSFGCVTN